MEFKNVVVSLGPILLRETSPRLGDAAQFGAVIILNAEIPCLPALSIDSAEGHALGLHPETDVELAAEDRRHHPQVLLHDLSDMQAVFPHDNDFRFEHCGQAREREHRLAIRIDYLESLGAVLATDDHSRHARSEFAHTTDLVAVLVVNPVFSSSLEELGFLVHD